MSKNLNCCQINTTLQEIYYENIMGKRFYSFGYYTTYYHLFKDLRKQELLCEKCVNYSSKLFEIYRDFNQKYQNLTK